MFQKNLLMTATVLLLLSVVFSPVYGQDSIPLDEESPSEPYPTAGPKPTAGSSGGYVQVVVDTPKECAFAWEKVDVTCKGDHSRSLLTGPQLFFLDSGEAFFKEVHAHFELNVEVSDDEGFTVRTEKYNLTASDVKDRCIDGIEYNHRVSWTESWPGQGNEVDQWEQFEPDTGGVVCTKDSYHEGEAHTGPTGSLTNPPIACGEEVCKCDNPAHVDLIWTYQIKNFRRFKPLRACKRSSMDCEDIGDFAETDEEGDYAGPWWQVGGAGISFECTYDGHKIVDYQGLTTAGRPGDAAAYHMLEHFSPIIYAHLTAEGEANGDNTLLQRSERQWTAYSKSMYPFDGIRWQEEEGEFDSDFNYVDRKYDWWWGTWGCTSCTPLLPVGAVCTICETSPPDSYAPLEQSESCRTIQINSKELAGGRSIQSNECPNNYAWDEYYTGPKDDFWPLYLEHEPTPLSYSGWRWREGGIWSSGEVQESGEAIESGFDFSATRHDLFEAISLPWNHFNPGWYDQYKQGLIDAHSGLVSPLGQNVDTWSDGVLQDDLRTDFALEEARSLEWPGALGNKQSSGLGVVQVPGSDERFIQVARCPFAFQMASPEDMESPPQIHDVPEEDFLARGISQLFQEPEPFVNVPETHCFNVIKCNQKCQDALASVSIYEDLPECPDGHLYRDFPQAEPELRAALEAVAIYDPAECRLTGAVFNMTCARLQPSWGRHSALPLVVEVDTGASCPAYYPFPAPDVQAGYEANEVPLQREWPSLKPGKTVCDYWDIAAPQQGVYYSGNHGNDLLVTDFTVDSKEGFCRPNILWGSRCFLREEVPPRDMDLNNQPQILPPFYSKATECDCEPEYVGSGPLPDCSGYADGASFPAEDGCNTCTCIQGVASCTKKLCATTEGPPPTEAAEPLQTLVEVQQGSDDEQILLEMFSPLQIMAGLPKALSGPRGPNDNPAHQVVV